ncbi:TIGR01620 family protein [Frigidibacter sp. MR17.14]|uniref:YcjF family protein n=1 Tax=Frigidibacter sp. MR17.14 TaxID=3126509 RepID=UPI003012FBB7
MTERRQPVILDRDETGPSPAEAPPVPDEGLPDGRAMQIAARIAARPPSRLAKFFWASTGALLSFLVTIAAWRFVEGLMAQYPTLGWIATVLFGLFLAAALGLALRELAAFARLARLDRLQALAAQAVRTSDLKAAREVSGRMASLYAGRPELAWGRDRLAARTPEVLDADGLLDLAEAELLGPLDQAARREIEASARTVATVTAVVPLALADVVTALATNLKMIRRIAEIYGGRAGTLGSLRLMRAVFTHLVATGAVAVGDDVIHTVAGGGLLAKLSRRFGEGIVNGALTARVGVAAMDVCRPLPFRALPRPKVSNLIGRGLAGLFPTGKDA